MQIKVINNEVESGLKDTQTKKKSNSKPKKQKKKTPTKLQQLRSEVEELKDRQLRQAAEHENYKKRSMRETERAIRRAGDYSTASFLPLLDDIDRTLISSKENSNTDSILEGLELIKSKFEKILKDNGVTPIESEGEKFNPDYHEAMMVEEDSSLENNIVIEEFERGFKIGDRILRPAKVKVNRRSDG